MLLIEYQYFPPVTVIKTSITCTHIRILSYEKFRKMSFRNRCIIPAANGLTTLSVPLLGGRENTLPMKDVRIDNSVNWQLRHWRTISSAYGRSPWFEHYAGGLEKYYLRRFDFLADWDIELLQWVLTCLDSQVNIEILEKEPEKGGQEIIIDYRNKILPKNFQEEKGIPDYVQVFQEKIGFQPNMSIIDLIFCEGKNARRYLR
jgi:WbqC-like protein family